MARFCEVASANCFSSEAIFSCKCCEDVSDADKTDLIVCFSSFKSDFWRDCICFAFSLLKLLLFALPTPKYLSIFFCPLDLAVSVIDDGLEGTGDVEAANLDPDPLLALGIAGLVVDNLELLEPTTLLFATTAGLVVFNLLFPSVVPAVFGGLLALGKYPKMVSLEALLGARPTLLSLSFGSDCNLDDLALRDFSCSFLALLEVLVRLMAEAGRLLGVLFFFLVFEKRQEVQLENKNNLGYVTLSGIIEILLTPFAADASSLLSSSSL